MSRHLSPTQAVLLGGIVLAGLLMAGYVLFALDAQRGFGGDSFHVTALLADLGGVEVGTRVRIQGIDAGEIAAVMPPERPGADATLKLRLKGNLRHLVTTDARVQIANENLLYGKVVRILPGSADSAPVEDGAVLGSQANVELTENLTKTVARLSTVLDDIEGTLHDLRKGQGTVGTMAQDLAQATSRLNRVALRIDNALKDVEAGKGNLGMLLKDDALYHDLKFALADVRTTMDGVRKGEGSLGQLVKDKELYGEAVQSLAEMRKMVKSVKQNSDAIKSLPVVRSYVVDIHKVLIRPECKRFVQWYPEEALFEPGRAVLTASGRERLDGAAHWLSQHKEAGSEVIIASYASDENGDLALTVTQKQSEAVADYLKSQHRVHRTGFWWWSTRTVRPLGVGNNPPPVSSASELPPRRIEIVVFVPEA